MTQSHDQAFHNCILLTMQKIPLEVINSLNLGITETRNLMEGLAVDMHVLWKHTLPKLPDLPQEFPKGITQKMNLCGRILSEHLSLLEIENLITHKSDTVRGWACYALFHLNLPLEKSLTSITPFADDTHFGVREWAWLALRPQIAGDISKSISLLTPWAHSPSPFIRRFASESTRPRGVWCMHIRSLREDPSSGLPLLSPMAHDPHKYVQDSVANWLNDASKDHPLWVTNICETWQQSMPQCPHTARIIKRAQRSLSKTRG